jgi:hypothetical protein
VQAGAPALAHEPPKTNIAGDAAATTPSLPATSLQPLAARYRVTVSAPKSAGQPTARTRQQDWYFYREPNRIAIVKGDIEEVWLRDGDGQIRFERVFHADRRIAEYSPGELKTLGIDTDWSALAGFVDGRVFANAKRVVAKPTAHGRVNRYEASTAASRTSLMWSQRLGLPTFLAVTPRTPNQRSVRYELLEVSGAAKASWPAAGQQTADYERTDSADFGDMESDPFVRKAEAMDVRTGWRKPHEH